ncbi:MAG: hypothetical protein AAF585_25875, partial [Verrucomicrobiota bacterium]
GVTPQRGSVARTPTIIEDGQTYELHISIRVVEDDMQFSLAVDGQPTLEWAGPIESLSNRPATQARTDLSRIHIGSYKDTVTWSAIRVKDPLNNLPPEEMAAARERVEEVLDRQRIEVQQSAARFRNGLTKLNTSYARILNRFASGEDEDLKLAAEEEIERMRQQLPDMEEGIDSLPPQLVNAREVYQTEFAKLAETRDVEARPVLAKHLEELKTLNKSLMDDGRIVEAGMVGEAISDLDSRLGKLETDWDSF